MAGGVAVALALGAGVMATRHPVPGAATTLAPVHAAARGVVGGAAVGSGVPPAAPVPSRSAGPAVFATNVAAANATSGAAASTAAGGGLGDVVVRRVEQSAQVTVRVKAVGQAFDGATALAGSLGGYVESSNLNAGGSGGASYASLVLAVPQNQFGACLKGVGALGTVADTTISGQDVTQTYVDLQGRIQALTAERESYLTLLGKATAIGDILQIQNALTDVQSQIESLTGQLRVLDDLSSMARVTVTLVPAAAAPVTPPHAPGAFTRVFGALRASARALANGATTLAEAVAWLLPWAVVGSAGWWAYRRFAPRARG